MLREKSQELILRDLFGLYTYSIKDKVHHLCDSHKAYLLRKAIYNFASNAPKTEGNSHLLSEDTIIKLQVICSCRANPCLQYAFNDTLSVTFQSALNLLISSSNPGLLHQIKY